MSTPLKVSCRTDALFPVKFSEGDLTSSGRKEAEHLGDISKDSQNT